MRTSRSSISFDPAAIGTGYKVMLNLKEGGKYFLSQFSRVKEEVGIPAKPFINNNRYPTSGEFIFSKGIDKGIEFSSLEEALLVTSLVETLYKLDCFRTGIIKLEGNSNII